MAMLFKPTSSPLGGLYKEAFWHISALWQEGTLSFNEGSLRLHLRSLRWLWTKTSHSSCCKQNITLNILFGAFILQNPKALDTQRQQLSDGFQKLKKPSCNLLDACTCWASLSINSASLHQVPSMHLVLKWSTAFPLLLHVVLFES